MTTSIITVLKEACSRTGLNASDAVPLHRHAVILYLLKTDGVVVRLNRDGNDSRRARTVVELTRWLTRLGFPSVAPAEVEQPLNVRGYTVTFWRYYPLGLKRS